eukprot:7573797-Pyramimonas_sp.AAC.1
MEGWKTNRSKPPTPRWLVGLCYYCEQAGVPGGQFGEYALAPGKQPGKYQNALDKVCPGPGVLYMVRTPGNRLRQAQRKHRDIPFRPAFEALDEEVQQNSNILRMLGAPEEERGESIMDLPCYKDHRVVLDNIANGRPPPIPIGFYVDGVRYTSIVSGRPDTVLGYWMINLLTGVRHVLGVQLD